jgi:hypothetical protein
MSDNSVSFRAPSIDQLVEVHQSLRGFIGKARYASENWGEQEDEYLPPYVCLYEALRSVRPVMDSVEGWAPEDRVGDILRAIVDEFDAITETWGWQLVAVPEPARTSYVKDRKKWFRDNVERPMYEAAVSWQTGHKGLICPVKDWAKKGREQGFTATMTAEQAEACFPKFRDAWMTTPRIGRHYPELTPEQSTRLGTAWNVLDDILKPFAPAQIQPPVEERPSPPSGAVGSTATTATEDSDPGRWVTVNEAARIAQLDNSGVISRAASTGKLKSNGKSGRQRLIDRQDLTRWIQVLIKRSDRAESDESVERKSERANSPSRRPR